MEWGEDYNHFSLYIAEQYFVEASVDANVTDSGIFAQDAAGHLISNGHFVFYPIFDGVRQLVLTTNDGVIIKKGTLLPDVTTWADPATWLPPTNYTFSYYKFTGITERKYAR